MYLCTQIYLMIMRKTERNSFIVSKALRTFVAAAVLTAAASQLAHTADSMIVGHVVGQDAVSAINLVLPLVEMLNCMGFLICFGANAICAHAIGSNDMDKVARTFTATILTVMTLGLAVSLGISLFSREIVEAMSEEPELNEMADEHIGTQDNEHMGLRLVTNIIPDITYKYMYGQNTIFIWKKV